MKVTFPYMGPVIAYRKVFELLGHDVIAPARPTQRTIDLGVKYSPEFICFPFKIILGSYLEAIERGAEVIVTSGGIGACRAVYYGNLSEQILRKLGYNVRVMVFDTLFEDFSGFYRQFQAIRNHKPLPDFIAAFHLAIRLIHACDGFQKELNHLRPYETIAGSCNRTWEEIQGLFLQCYSMKTLIEDCHQADRMIAKIPLNPSREVLKVGLVGEIYLVMESSSNNDLEDKLAGLGVEVARRMYISDWIHHCFFPPRKMLSQAANFLKYGVGGHEQENIGYIINYKEMGFDGIIHLLPFGCMPELVTQTLIPALSAKLDMPILSLSLDEQTGWVNLQIRLEAFVDLLRNRKEMSKGTAHEAYNLRY